MLEKELQETTEYYSRVPVMQGSAIRLFELVRATGLEGIVLKRRDGLYQTRSRPCEPGEKASRSWTWQKVINYYNADVVITGYSKEDHRLLIGTSEDGRIKPLGTMEHGKTAKHRKVVWPQLRNSTVGENKKFVFVEPIVQCKVKHRGFYKSGLLRLPILEAITG